METLHNFVNLCKEYPSASILCLFLIGYILYYFNCVAKKPLLACKDKKLRQFLANHVPIVFEKFWPTFWCFESRAMTIIRSFIETSPDIMYECELLSMPDGGQVRLDWMNNNDSPQYPDNDTRPTVVMLPGLTGTSFESYILNLVNEAKKLGYRVVVFNNRGNGSKLLTPRTYCAANTEDLGRVVHYVKSKYPDAPLMGTGVSLGGMILFSYLAKTGKDCGMLAGMCVSMAWNVFESVETLEKPGINKHILNRMLAKGLVENFKKNMHLFESHIDDVHHVLKSTTIREFDDRFTAPMFGYQTWEDYYRDACIHDKVHALEVPVLCLNAADDPFSPHYAIPVNEAEDNDNIAILVTSHGGHIGFLDGLLPRQPTYMYRMFSQYMDGVFKHAGEYIHKNE
ncbi:phospholipase ABHD3-like [Mya arenaria]|uniref:phospholipase ABHD3-like n=1 Tax=Mya arenaria TaxID=6604 RepID=UPI0022E6DFB3|nr:phospholipase ABHD3-like [Mya arenaria]